MQKYPHIIELFDLYSKNVGFDVFIRDKFFNFFKNIFNTKTIEIKNFTSFTK